MATAKKEADPGGRPGFRDRFHAWWEGYEPARPSEPPAAATGAAARDGGGADEPRAAARIWPTAPVEVVQEIWGPGFARPGGDEFLLSHLAGFGARPGPDILDIGAGLGGASRAIARTFDARVAAYELDEDLAAEAASRIRRDCPEDDISVSRLGPEIPDLRKGFFRGAFLHDVLYRIEDRSALLDRVAFSLEAGGEVVILDVVAGDEPGIDGDWPLAEPGRVNLASPGSFAEDLAAMGLDIRIDRDHSRVYRSVIIDGLSTLARRLEDRRPPAALLTPTMREVERWARFLSALESRALGYRWVSAVKP